MSGARAAVLSQAFITLGFVLGAGFSASPKLKRSIGIIAVALGVVAIAVQYFSVKPLKKAWQGLAVLVTPCGIEQLTCLSRIS